MLLAIHLFVMGLFVLLGVIFWFGKGVGLIAGYNTASVEEKAKFDEKKLCRVMSKLMFVLAGCWFIVVLSEIFETTILFWVGQILFFVSTIAGVVYLNTGNRCRK